MEEDRAFLTASHGPPAYHDREYTTPDGRAGRDSSRNSHADDGSPDGSQHAKESWSGASAKLQRSSYILFIVSVYASLATIS